MTNANASTTFPSPDSTNHIMNIDVSTKNADPVVNMLTTEDSTFQNPPESSNSLPPSHDSTSSPNHLINNAIVLFDPNNPVQDLLDQVELVKHNNIADSTRLQYLSSNRSLVLFLFDTFRNVISPEFIDRYHEASESSTPRQFSLYVKESLNMNKVCPFSVDEVTNEFFLLS